MKTTKNEQAVITALKRIAKKWPKSLWIFAGDGTFNVMKKKPDGTTATTEDYCVDQDYIVDTVDIEIDGGGW